MLYQMICHIVLFHMYISYLYTLLWWHWFNYCIFILYDKFFTQKVSFTLYGLIRLCSKLHWNELNSSKWGPEHNV